MVKEVKRKLMMVNVWKNLIQRFSEYSRTALGISGYFSLLAKGTACKKDLSLSKKGEE